jgi:hypothetical protein
MRDVGSCGLAASWRTRDHSTGEVSMARANRLSASYTQDRHYHDGEFAVLTRRTEICRASMEHGEKLRASILRLRR